MRIRSNAKEIALHNANLFPPLSLSVSLSACLRTQSRFIDALTREIAIRVFARLLATGTRIRRQSPIIAILFSRRGSTYRAGVGSEPARLNAALSRSFLDILLSRTILRFFSSRTCVAYPIERRVGATARRRKLEWIDRSPRRDASLRP